MDKSLAAKAPLAGIRVVDFGHYIAGPAAGMLLADQGAEVVKIDRPGRPAFDTPINAVLNRNKKKIELDLKIPEGVQTARKLIETADVVIENFRPGVMKRLGLGPGEMTKTNPRLIYLSLPGFASSDKEKANIRAFEGVISAATTLFFDLHPAIRRLLGAPPVYTPLPEGSAYGAVHGAIAVALALYDREETGKGEVIEISLAGANMSAITGMVLQAEKSPSRFGPRPTWWQKHVKIPAERRRVLKMGEKERHAYWREILNRRKAFFDSFQTGDGEWIHILTGGNSRLSTQLLKALGIYQKLIDEGMVDKPTYENLGIRNNVKDSSILTPHWHARTREEITNAFKQKSAAEWTEIMKEFSVPFSVHRTAQEWLNAPEVEAGGFAVTVDDPEYGPLRQPGVQCTLSKTPVSWLQPKSAEVLKGNPEELWQAPENSPGGGGASSDEKYQILQGIRVLDVSTVLAGPTCARVLAEYGADIIKIDPPDPKFGPFTECFQPMEVSQGKRSIILDMKTEEGMKVFLDLVKTADIVVSNMSPGTPERLGIDYKSLTKHKPDIIFAHLTAFNGPKTGPWSNLKGFDPVLQAATGLQRRYSGEGHKPILHGWASCIDYLTGYSGSYGTALALFKRRRSGEGDLIKTTLAQGGQLTQIPFMYSSEKYKPGYEPSGQECLGEHSLQYIYKAKGGYLFLGGLKTDLPKLKDIPGLSGAPLEEDDEERRIQFLQRAIAKRSVSYWVKTFNDAGFGCHRVDCVEDLRKRYLHKVKAGAPEKEWYDGRSISINRMMDHPYGRPVDNVSPTYGRFGRTEIRLLKPLPKLGANTREVLLEIGYSDDQIEGLLSKGIAKESLHKDYLPS